MTDTMLPLMARDTNVSFDNSCKAPCDISMSDKLILEIGNKICVPKAYIIYCS